MDIFSSIQVQEASKADLIIENGAKTYLCYLQPSKLSEATSATAQNAWRIECYDVTTDSGTTTTKLTYPNGSKDFCFAPDEIENYIFNFKR